MREHDKIINAAAKKVLFPKGLFRKGTSRVWLDDNGYFITQVEFQPSAREKGSFLNVGISFLWKYSETLNTRLAFDYGYRVDVLVQRSSKSSRLWHIYDMSMICFLKGDLEDGTKFFNDFMCDLKDCIYEHDYYIEWRDKLYNHCVQCIQPRLDSKQNAQKMVFEMIERRRNFFSSQPPFKNMNKKMENNINF